MGKTPGPKLARDTPLDAPDRLRIWLASAVGAALSIAGVTALSRVVGFGRTIAFARAVGPTCLGDTYLTANTVPNIVFEVVAGGALASLVVPVLAGAVARGDREQASRTASALLSWALLVSVPVTILGLLVARPLIGLLIGSSAAGCNRHDELVVGTRMLLIFMPQVVFYAICIVFTGILQAHKRFLGPALAPLLSSVVVIGAYVTFGLTSVADDMARVGLGAQLLLAIGTTAGVVALSLPLLWPVSRLKLRLRPTLRFPQAVGRRVAGLAVAGAVTLAAQQLSVAVVLRLAHRGATGTLVLYNLAWAVFLVPWSVAAVPIATSAFPRLAARADDGDDHGYAISAARGLRVVVLASAVAAAAVVACAVPVARVLALRVPGNADTVALAWTLVAFAPGLLGYGLVAYVGRAFYARATWRFAAAAICVGWLAVIIADFALIPAFSPRWRVVALAVGNSIGMTIAGILLVAGLAGATARRALEGLKRTAAASFAGASAGIGAGLGVATAIGARSAVASVFVTALVGALTAAVAVAVAVAFEPAHDRRQLGARILGRRPVGGDTIG